MTKSDILFNIIDGNIKDTDINLTGNFLKCLKGTDCVWNGIMAVCESRPISDHSS